MRERLQQDNQVQILKRVEHINTQVERLDKLSASIPQKLADMHLTRVPQEKYIPFAVGVGRVSSRIRAGYATAREFFEHQRNRYQDELAKTLPEVQVSSETRAPKKKLVETALPNGETLRMEDGKVSSAIKLLVQGYEEGTVLQTDEIARQIYGEVTQKRLKNTRVLMYHVKGSLAPYNLDVANVNPKSGAGSGTKGEWTLVVREKSQPTDEHANPPETILTPDEEVVVNPSEEAKKKESSYLDRNEALVLSNLINRRNRTEVLLESGQEFIMELPEQEIAFLHHVLNEHPNYIQEKGIVDKTGYYMTRNLGLKKILTAIEEERFREFVNHPSGEKIVEAVQIVLTADVFSDPIVPQVITGLLAEDIESVWMKERNGKQLNGEFQKEGEKESNGTLVNEHEDNIDFFNPESLRSAAAAYLDQFEENYIHDGSHMTAFYRIYGRLRNRKHYDSAESEGIITPIGRANKHRTRRYSRLDYIKLLCVYDAGDKFATLKPEEKRKMLELIEHEYYKEVEEREKHE